MERCVCVLAQSFVSYSAILWTINDNCSVLFGDAMGRGLVGYNPMGSQKGGYD